MLGHADACVLRMGPRVGVVVMCPWLTEEQREAVRKMAAADDVERRRAERRQAWALVLILAAGSVLTWWIGKF